MSQQKYNEKIKLHLLNLEHDAPPKLKNIVTTAKTNGTRRKPQINMELMHRLR